RVDRGQLADRGDRPRWPPVHPPGSGHLRVGAARGKVARRAQPLLAAALPVRDRPWATCQRHRVPVSVPPVRPPRPTDAAILAEMANDLNDHDHVGIHGRPFTPKRICADGFGPKAAFTPLVAEIDGVVVGYPFFSLGYNTDIAARSMWLH